MTRVLNLYFLFLVGEILTVSSGNTLLKTLAKESAYSGEKLCGIGYGDEVENVEIIFEHSTDSLDLIFLDNLSSYPEDESWGIRNLRISLKGCSVES